MELYIPKHLRNITIIGQLCKMIEEYVKQDSDGNYKYYEDPINSFDDYRFCLKSDPVKNFVSLCLLNPINEEDELPEDVDNNDIIDYITKLFYSVKGTKMVFNYMERYLHLIFKSEVKYTSRNLVMDLDVTKINITDENLFYDSFINFLEALLYFTNLDCNIGIIKLKIEDIMESFIGGNAISYKKFDVERDNV